MELVVSGNGDVRCVYSESIDLRRLGRMIIRRGSNVEPDAHGNWHAHLAPVNGPTLGPFASRSQALAAEVEWLSRNWLNKAVENDVRNR